MMAGPANAKAPGGSSAQGPQESNQQAAILGEDGSEIQMFRMLERRFQRLSLHLFPLYEDALLLSSDAGLSRVLPDFRVAHHVLRQMEGGAA